MRYIEVLEQLLGRKARKNLLPMQPGDMPTPGPMSRPWRGMWATGPRTDLEEGVQAFRRVVSRLLPPSPRLSGRRARAQRASIMKRHLTPRMPGLWDVKFLSCRVAAVAAHARDIGQCASARSRRHRRPALAAFSRSSTTPGCSISHASASRSRPCRCCSSWRGRRVCRRASPPCSAAIRSTAPRSARCCTPRCARISPARRPSRPRSGPRARNCELCRRGAPRQTSAG